MEGRSRQLTSVIRTRPGFLRCRPRKVLINTADQPTRRRQREGRTCRPVMPRVDSSVTRSTPSDPLDPGPSRRLSGAVTARQRDTYRSTQQ